MPFVIPPLVKWTISAIGAAVATKWLYKEWQRVNAELDRIKTGSVVAEPERGAPTLQRDPVTGVYTPRHQRQS